TVGKSHYMKGWHATSTLGHVGAAAAAARLLGLNREQTLNALGIAATQAGGLKRVFGTMCKPFHAGNAAANAVSSVLLAEDGFTSANNIIEGPFGFLSVMASENNVS
ncbi:MAG TPA: MmgE/PrpD family protein, partial [Gammaproteobacteria bacterium]|nr:MmgE/PrpD family protein [Gammaproteobacteria bacterium]